MKHKKNNSLVIQYHHPDYSRPNFTVPLYKGEHFLITRLDRKFRLSTKKPFSKGMLFSLYCLFIKYWDKGQDIQDFFTKKFL